MEFSTNPLSKPLTSADVADIEEAAFHYCLTKTRIVDRAYYIFRTIANHLKVRIPTKVKYNDDDLEYLSEGDLVEGINCKDAFREYFLNPFNGLDFKDKNTRAIINGQEYDFKAGTFPYRWLFIDFEQELIDGIKQYEKKLEEQKHLTNLKKKRSRFKSKIVDRLKKTMTPEEIEIVFGKDQNVSS